MNTAEQSCGAFLDALASKAPVPGGGGASALAGALGAALCTMVGNYTVGKQKYAAVEEDVKALMARAEDLRARLLGLVDTDAAAFEPLSRAYAIPKEDPSRGEVMERCLRDAAAAPMEILRLCCEAIDLHSEMLDKGSVMVLSDVGTGAVLCWGALYGAWLNVKVNTKSMADRPYAEAMNDEADGLVEQYWKRAEQIYESVMGRYTVIRRINEDGAIHGCLLFRPLPRHLDEAAVCAALSPVKDVDGITSGSLASVFSGDGQGYPPCTAQACLELLDYYGFEPTGRRAVVVGRSLVIGRPAAMLLLNRNATVTLCHTRTADLAAECRRAELLIAAAGRAGIIGANCLSPGQVVIDVGINVDAAGHLVGDVDFAAAEAVVGAVTPVPGGVGAVTTSVLARHVLDAAAKSADISL